MTATPHESATGAPNLVGLALAGGASRRMGRDKGALDYHGEPQAAHVWRLLEKLCGAAYVSTNASRAESPPYSTLPLILDAGDYEGPASGLLAAWERYPDAAWLVLAVDMPLVDEDLLTALIRARDTDAFATCFQHDDGTVEPLCSIWEPAAREPLRRDVQAGRRSPRRFLMAHRTSLLRPPDPRKLASANDADSFETLRRKIGS